MMPIGSGSTRQDEKMLSLSNERQKVVVPFSAPQHWVKTSCCWQEEPADSWEETLEVKDSWEMEEETAKVKKIVDPH
jgi:hypothetical protein